MALSDGLMMPTTSPARLASRRTLTHVVATAGTHWTESAVASAPSADAIINVSAIDSGDCATEGAGAGTVGGDKSTEYVGFASNALGLDAFVNAMDNTSATRSRMAQLPTATSVMAAIPVADRNAIGDRQRDGRRSPHQ